MDALIPPEDWVNEATYSDDYDTSCPTCSALVENRAVHRAWHLAMVELARQYVEPPRYG